MSLEDSKTNGHQDVGQQHSATFIPPSARKAYDKDVTFEEYIHYATKTRAEEKERLPNVDKSGGLLDQFKEKVLRRGSATTAVAASTNGSDSPNEKDAPRRQSRLHDDGRAVITDDEWRNASRMMRTASCEYHSPDQILYSFLFPLRHTPLFSSYTFHLLPMNHISESC